MNYGLDFNKISVNEFYDYIEARDLMKSHHILKDDIDFYRSFFYTHEIRTLDELYNEIKTKPRVVKFSKEHILDEDYLIILRRHIMSFVVKPRKIDDFKMMDPVARYILEAENIKTTKELFFSPQLIIRCPNLRYIKGILELTTLRYVSASFAEAIFLSEYETIKDIAAATPEEFRDKINETSKKYDLFKSVFGLSDSKYLIDDAKLFCKWQNL